MLRLIGIGLVLCRPIAVRCAGPEANTAAAAIGQSFQGEGTSDGHYSGPPLGGTAFSIIGLADHQIGTVWSLGAEASLASAIEDAQYSLGSATGGSFVRNTFVTRHKDVVLSGVLKGRLSNPASRGQFAMVAGFGLALRLTDRVGTSAPDLAPFTPVTTFHQSDDSWVPAATFGLDIAVAITDRVSVLALGRLHALIDNDQLSNGLVHRGVSSLVWRFGIGAQWRY